MNHQPASGEQIEDTISTWGDYFQRTPWRELRATGTPKETGCGLLYECGNPLGRPDEDLAIADMRNLKVSQPHWHPAPDIEIYLILEGTADVYVGRQSHRVGPGDSVIIPSNHTHFTIPLDAQVVLAAINIPPFAPDRYIAVTPENPHPNFDPTWFRSLVGENHWVV